VVIATAIFAGAAGAQMKLPEQQPPTATTQSPVILSTEPSLESAKRILRDEAMKMVKQQKAVWIDVRLREAFNEGHIAGAINIPESELPARLKELPAKKYLITYCA
jgi:3-mercaptopyruvate sulfurtransferase SseA